MELIGLLALACSIVAAMLLVFVVLPTEALGDARLRILRARDRLWLARMRGDIRDLEGVDRLLAGAEQMANHVDRLSMVSFLAFAVRQLGSQRPAPWKDFEGLLSAEEKQVVRRYWREVGTGVYVGLTRGGVTGWLLTPVLLGLCRLDNAMRKAKPRDECLAMDAERMMEQDLVLAAA